MTVTISPIHERDFFAWYALFTEYAAGEGVAADDARTMRLWTALQSPAAHAVLASNDGETVGFAHFTEFSRLLQGDGGFTIDDIFVLPGRRRQGVAAAMVEHIRSRAEDERRGAIRWIGDRQDAAVRGLQQKFADATGEWAVHELIR